MNTDANTVNTDASNETEYTWRSMSPDFRLMRGEVTVHADSAHIEPDSTRPWR